MREKDSSVVVRIAFWPYWLFAFAWSTVLFTLAVVSIDEGRIKELLLYGELIVFIGIWVALGTWGIQVFLTTRFTSTEIKGFNTACLPVVIRWEDISKTNIFNFLGLKYLRIFSKGRFWALWVPLQISNKGIILKRLNLLNENANRLLIFWRSPAA